MDSRKTARERLGPVIVGWIVDDRCRRLHGEIGAYHWSEWRRAACALGLNVQIARAGPVLPATLTGSTIVIRGGLDPRTTAFLVYHEIGHAVLHAGTPGDWRNLPGGIHLVNKFERQANEFAETFPDWE